MNLKFEVSCPNHDYKEIRIIGNVNELGNDDVNASSVVLKKQDNKYICDKPLLLVYPESAQISAPKHFPY